MGVQEEGTVCPPPTHPTFDTQGILFTHYFHLFFCSIYSIGNKNKKKKWSLNLSSGKRTGPWERCENSRAVGQSHGMSCRSFRIGDHKLTFKIFNPSLSPKAGPKGPTTLDPAVPLQD